MPTTSQPTQYEVDRINRALEARTEAARRQRIQVFCKDREDAIHLDSSATQLRARISNFDDPQNDFRTKVQSARKWRRWGLFTLFAVLLIATADFWLAMPDVSECLANKATSLITQIQDQISDSNTVNQKTSALATPVLLRLGIGITIVCTWLALTLGWKAYTDTTELRTSGAMLVPGDDEGYRKIQRGIWLRRVGRIGYMAILAGLFCYLYTFDLQRARDTVVLHQLEKTTTTKIVWPDLGLGLSNDELETNEATSKPSPDQQAGPTDPEQAARNLARPQVLVYTLLAMLHGLLLVIPAGQRPDDASLARFDRGKAERTASQLWQEEQALLRSMATRIREAPADEKDTLVVEAMPVAALINKAVAWNLLEVPAVTTQETGGANQTSPVGDSVAYDPADLGQAINQTTTTPSPTNMPSRTSHGDSVDPYDAIFPSPVLA